MGNSNPVVTEWLRNAYSMELGLIPVLEDQAHSVKDQQMQKMLDLHLQATRKHAQLLKDRLEKIGDRISTVKPATDVGAVYRKPDGKDEVRAYSNTLSEFITESFEAASYRALAALARHINDPETAQVADEILQDEMRAIQDFDAQLPGTRSTPATSRSTDSESVDVVRKSFDALNEHNLDRWSQFLTDSYRGEAPGVKGQQSKAQIREYNQIFIDAFPDLHFTLTQIIAQGDRVVVQWEATGTHRGQLRDPSGDMVIQPTGRKVTGTGCTILETKSGKLTRGWLFWDMANLLNQIGAMPSGQQSKATM